MRLSMENTEDEKEVCLLQRSPRQANVREVNIFCKLHLGHMAIFVLIRHQCPSCLSRISTDLSL